MCEYEDMCKCEGVRLWAKEFFPLFFSSGIRLTCCVPGTIRDA